MRYWTTGPGGARIRWGEAGDFDRCVVELSEHVGPGIVKGLCSNLHQRATGFRPGHAPSEQRSNSNLPELQNNEAVEEWAVNTKSMGRVEIKNADLGEVEAVFATLNSVDSDGDVTLPGAFQEGAPVKISAYGHLSWQGMLPVGKGTIHTVGNEAILKGQFFMNTQGGRDTFEVVKQLGDQQEWSYGYDPAEFSHGEMDGKSVRFLKKQTVFEVSPTLRGAGVGTRLLSAKSALAVAGAGQDPAGFTGWPSSEEAIKAVLAEEALATEADASTAAQEAIARAGTKQASTAIDPHRTPVVTTAWTPVTTLKQIPEAARPSDLRSVFAWRDPNGDPELKSSYHLGHHEAMGGPANLRAVAMGIAALNGPEVAGIPEEERKAAYDHLAAHMRDADQDPPELRTGPVSALKFFDHGAAVMAAVSGFIDRASEVMAFRGRKGKGMSASSVELISWIDEEAARLKTLLTDPQSVAEEESSLRDEELSMLMAAQASVQNL